MTVDDKVKSVQCDSCGWSVGFGRIDDFGVFRRDDFSGGRFLAVSVAGGLIFNRCMCPVLLTGG